MIEKGFWYKFYERLSTRSIVVVVLLIGAIILAILDPSFRPAYADLTKFGLGGYFAQLFPGKKES